MGKVGVCSLHDILMTLSNTSILATGSAAALMTLNLLRWLLLLLTLRLGGSILLLLLHLLMLLLKLLLLRLLLQMLSAMAARELVGEQDVLGELRGGLLRCLWDRWMSSGTLTMVGEKQVLSTP